MEWKQVKGDCAIPLYMYQSVDEHIHTRNTNSACCYTLTYTFAKRLESVLMEHVWCELAMECFIYFFATAMNRYTLYMLKYNQFN